MVASYASTVPSEKLATRSNAPAAFAERVMPLYTAPGRVARTSAVVPRAPRHPEIVPSSLAKMKRSPLKAGVLLNSWPVTQPSPGMVTCKPSLVTTTAHEASLVTEYRVARPVPLALIQYGLVGLNEMPQAFTRF